MSKIRMASSLAGFAAVLALAGFMAIRSFPLQAAPKSVKDAAGVKVEQDETKLLHRAPVQYPRDALQKGIQGTVIVDATLDQKGEVTDAQVVSGPQELRKAALESVLQWHYDLASGVPPKVHVAIDFVLPPPGAPAAVQSVPGVQPVPIPGLRTVKRIETGSLPQPLRDAIAARIPIHIGDRVTGADIANARDVLGAIDEHLQMAVNSGPDANASIYISLKDQSPAPERIRVGGNVQAMNLINKVVPAYPPQAKQARIQGVVRFTAYIAKDGHIENLELVSGHPLLVEAAQEAVRQWVYKPTLLNGNPVEVITQIDVNFTLSDNAPPPPAAQP